MADNSNRRSVGPISVGASPSETIIRNLWGEFKAQTKRKLDETMAFGIVCCFCLKSFMHNSVVGAMCVG